MSTLEQLGMTEQHEQDGHQRRWVLSLDSGTQVAEFSILEELDRFVYECRMNVPKALTCEQLDRIDMWCEAHCLASKALA